jgi:transcription antitermination protein NusB
MEARAGLEEKLEILLGMRWTGKRMPMLMRAILLCAVYELIYTPTLRASIIINQYVGVADAFLDDSDIGFVGGVLQEMTKALRPEISIPAADA